MFIPQICSNNYGINCSTHLYTIGDYFIAGAKDKTFQPVFTIITHMAIEL